MSFWKLVIGNWKLRSACCTCGVLEALVNVRGNYNRVKVGSTALKKFSSFARKSYGGHFEALAEKWAKCWNICESEAT